MTNEELCLLAKSNDITDMQVHKNPFLHLNKITEKFIRWWNKIHKQVRKYEADNNNTFQVFLTGKLKLWKRTENDTNTNYQESKLNNKDPYLIFVNKRSMSTSKIIKVCMPVTSKLENYKRKTYSKIIVSSDHLNYSSTKTYIQWYHSTIYNLASKLLMLWGTVGTLPALCFHVYFDSSILTRP